MTSSRNEERPSGREVDRGFSYVGGELELFAQARNWKRYLEAQIDPYLDGEVLEVGAGLGATTEALCDGRQKRWLCLEPDAGLAERIPERPLPAICEVRPGTLAGLADGETFDTILYVDVLEHIKDDAAELEAASRHLRPGGHLVVLSPAHPWLFSPFDEAVGHYRRYTRTSLTAAGPEALELVRCRHLDSLGLLTSLGNRLILREEHPTPGQIRFWDRVLVPGSRCLDPVVGWRWGRSILAVWRA